jgi:hypothetical protein
VAPERLDAVLEVPSCPRSPTDRDFQSVSAPSSEKNWVGECSDNFRAFFVRRPCGLAPVAPPRSDHLASEMERRLRSFENSAARVGDTCVVSRSSRPPAHVDEARTVTRGCVPTFNSNIG